MKIPHMLSGVALAMLTTVAAAEEFVPRLERPTSGPLAVDIKVNDAVVTQGQVEILMQNLLVGSDEDQKRGDLPALKQAARKDLVTQEALAQAALAKGMDRDIEVADALQYSRREILSRVFVEDYFRSNPVTEDMIRTAYEFNIQNGKIFEYKVRQILLPTREQAEAVVARMKKGEKFVDLTRLTKDPGGNANQGYLSKTGWFRPDLFVDAYFAEAVENQPLNQPSSEPFRTRFGWHLILVEEKRKVEKPEPYEKLHSAVKEAMQQRLAQRRLNELIRSEANKAKLTDAQGKPLKFEELDAIPAQPKAVAKDTQSEKK